MHIYVLTNCNAIFFNFFPKKSHCLETVCCMQAVCCSGSIYQLPGYWAHHDFFRGSTGWWVLVGIGALNETSLDLFLLLFWILLGWKFLWCGPRLAWETWHRMSSALASLLSIQYSVLGIRIMVTIPGLESSCRRRLWFSHSHPHEVPTCEAWAWEWTVPWTPWYPKVKAPGETWHMTLPYFKFQWYPGIRDLLHF